MQSPWHVFLDTAGARFHECGATEHGTLSFQEARNEVELAATETVAIPLTHLGLMRANGEEAALFLHNLLSNDVKGLELHHAQLSSLNSPKGRMLASFFVWRDSLSYLLAVSSDLLAPIYKKLSMYILRSKLQLADITSETALIGLAGPNAATSLDALGLALPPDSMSVRQGAITIIRMANSRLILAMPVAQAAEIWQRLMKTGIRKAGTEAWRWLEIQEGIPTITLATQDEFVPQMLNFELIGGINFQKGCYPGQEIVARTQYLGKLKKRMYLAHVEEADVKPGQDLFSAEFGDQSCGKIVSVAPAPGSGTDMLAVSQISCFEANDVHLFNNDGPRLVFGSLPYAVQSS